MEKKESKNALGEKLNHALDKFLRHIDSVKDTLPMFMLLVSPYAVKSVEEFGDFLKNNAKEIKTDKDTMSLLIKSDEAQLFETLEKNASISKIATKIVPESLFVSLISQYDAFLNRLLRVIFEIKPEILNSADRSITFSQLVEYGSVQDARNYIIEKEIDTVLRKSHSEQFDYLERILAMELRKDLSAWKAFVEITERRNLFVHCDGVISSQYVKNCSLEENKYFSIGKKIDVTPEYFIEAYRCLYEITVKLTHTVWRKLLLSDMKNADNELNCVCYNLINNKSYNLADTILQFACEQKKKHNSMTENIFTINLALSKHLNGKQVEVKNILEKKDWSACSDEFKLAFEIISENYEEAYLLMKKIGKNGNVSKTEYKQWPLFKKIREKKEFKKVYKEIFKEDYSILETPRRPLAELIEKFKKDSIKKKNSKKIASNK